jgi:hypothetical protein
MLLDACQEYEAIIVATDPLPSLENKVSHSQLAWDKVCTRRELKVDLDEDMITVVCYPLSHFTVFDLTNMSFP